MKKVIQLDDEFVGICREIVGRNLSEPEWAEIESDDEFQSVAYRGGFDATEKAFCFSYYDEDSREYWFQLSLAEVHQVAAGALCETAARTAE